MPSLLRRLASRLRGASSGDDAPKSPIRALLDIIADQLDRLSDAQDKQADESYIGTADGQRRRPDPSDRPRRRKNDP